MTLLTRELSSGSSILKFEPTVLKPACVMTALVESLLAAKVDQTSSLGRSSATSLAGLPWRSAKRPVASNEPGLALQMTRGCEH